MKVFQHRVWTFSFSHFFILSLKFDVVKVEFFHSSFEPFSLKKRKSREIIWKRAGILHIFANEKFKSSFEREPERETKQK